MPHPNPDDDLNDPNKDDPDAVPRARAGNDGAVNQPLGEADGEADDDLVMLPRLTGRGSGRSLKRKGEDPSRPLTAKDRLHLLDLWSRSGLPAQDFATLVGVTKHTLYAWKSKFAKEGPAGLATKPRGNSKKSVQLTELTKRAILLLKQANPSYGCERISDLLRRDEALGASPETVSKVLKESGFESVEVPTRRHEPAVARFERATPNELWQTDIFTFVLKRQNRRVYLVAFMDDNSRFVVGYGLHASQSAALVLEVFRASVAAFQAPKEVLTDNGSQYVTWRGKSAFSKECERQGIKQIVARPHRPQTLGKIERFWGSLWREFLGTAIFYDLEDARRRIGLFIDHYNFRRTHKGVDGLVPADRFFGAAPDVKRTLAARLAANALELARHGVPKKPFYLTGQIDGRAFSIHAEGERLILTKPGSREEIELAPKSATSDAGQRVLDVVASRACGRTMRLADLREELKDVERGEVDAALVALDRAGAIALGRPVDLAELTQADREAALMDPHRGQLVYVSSSLEPVGETLPPSVCPDGSPPPGVAEEDPGERPPGTSPLDQALGPPTHDEPEAGEVSS